MKIDVESTSILDNFILSGTIPVSSKQLKIWISGVILNDKLGVNIFGSWRSGPELCVDSVDKRECFFWISGIQDKGVSKRRCKVVSIVRVTGLYFSSKATSVKYWFSLSAITSLTFTIWTLTVNDSIPVPCVLELIMDLIVVQVFLACFYYIW